MTQYTHAYAKLRREIEKLGVETRDTSRGGFAAHLPDGVTVRFITTGDPKSLDQQRTAFVRAGLTWPNDPKPRKPRAPRPPLPTTDDTAPIETENPMTAPKATTPPDIEIIDVTPAIAEEWLEKNTSNRSLSDKAVSKHAEAMTSGLWHYDGSPIRFDNTGKLIDGQHRLWAIIESGTTQKFIVMRNLDPRAFVTIDTGKTRSFGDILSIEYPSMKSVHHIASVTSMLWRWHQGVRGKGLRATGNIAAAAPEELLKFFVPQRAEIVELQRRSNAVTNRVRGIGGTTVALLMHILNKIDTDDAEFFFDRLQDGVGLEAGSPILALRDAISRFVSANQSNRTTMPTELGVALGIKAWNAYRRGDDVKQLKFRVGGAKPESFPEAE